MRYLFYSLFTETKSKELEMKGPYIHMKPSETVSSEPERYMMDDEEVKKECKYLTAKYSNSVIVFKIVPFNQDHNKTNICIFLNSMITNYDMTLRDECDSTFLVMARSWAAKIVEGKGTNEHRLVNTFKAALSLPPSAEYKQLLLKFLARQRQHYSSQNQSINEETFNVEIAAWTQLCCVVLHLHQTIIRDLFSSAESYFKSKYELMNDNYRICSK